VANRLERNFTRRVMDAFIPAFEKQRVLSKTVDSQLFKGKFTPKSGEYVDIKRPHRYKSKRTTGGDISSLTANNIVSARAFAKVQDYITVDIEWTNKEEALELNQLTEIIAPAAVEAVTTLETSLGEFMLQNAGLSYGTPGNAVSTWGNVAGARSFMNAIGAPMGDKYYVMNDFTVEALADVQNSLTGGADRLVTTAWEEAQISTKFAGLNALASNSMATRTSGSSADRVGALAATPTATYANVKDNYVQSLSLTGLTVSKTAALKAGDILEFTGTGSLARSYIHQLTRQTAFGSGGTPLKWRCTVLEDADTDSSGETTVSVAGPAVYESGGAYNTISAALASGDVFTILGAVDVEIQPNLFYLKEAFSVAYVKIPKLYSTDTRAVTSDGVALRTSLYADGDKNEQKMRIDMLPAFGVLNPFWAGQGFGFA